MLHRDTPEATTLHSARMAASGLGVGDQCTLQGLPTLSLDCARKSPAPHARNSQSVQAHSQPRNADVFLAATSRAFVCASHEGSAVTVHLLPRAPPAQAASHSACDAAAQPAAAQHAVQLQLQPPGSLPTFNTAASTMIPLPLAAAGCAEQAYAGADAPASGREPFGPESAVLDAQMAAPRLQQAAQPSTADAVISPPLTSIDKIDDAAAMLQSGSEDASAFELTLNAGPGNAAQARAQLASDSDADLVTRLCLRRNSVAAAGTRRSDGSQFVAVCAAVSLQDQLDTGAAEAPERAAAGDLSSDDARMRCSVPSMLLWVVPEDDDKCITTPSAHAPLCALLDGGFECGSGTCDNAAVALSTLSNGASHDRHWSNSACTGTAGALAYCAELMHASSVRTTRCEQARDIAMCR